MRGNGFLFDAHLDVAAVQTPFAQALAAVEHGSLDTPPLSPYVTKLHTKTDGDWRWRLTAAAYACPLLQASATLVGSWSLLARYAPAHDDHNTSLWGDLYSAGLLAREPQPCQFVAGTAFTTLRSCLEEVVGWVRPPAQFETSAQSYASSRLCDRASSAAAMRTGQDGQVEHVLERYLGLLTVTNASVTCPWNQTWLEPSWVGAS